MNTRASRKFETGPAAATSMCPLRMVTSRRKLAGLYGVGLAQPRRGRLVKIWMSGNRSVPIGSMCTIGLRLTRPRFLAVSSPSFQAIQACADSWKDRLKRRTTYVVRPSAMC